MKIVSGVEPLYCEVNDLSHKVIVDISATTTKDQLLDSIRKWMPLSFESMVHLSDWKDVLNKIDQQLSNTLHAWRKNIVLLGKEDGGTEQVEDASYFSDVEDLKTMLKFTSQLLKCSINKEVYNSTEHLVELLTAYDDEVMILALDALLSLAVPPLSHRCNLDMTRHLTSLHRNTSYFDPLFEIIESSYFVTDIPIHQFLSADFAPTAAIRRVKVDLNTRSKYCKSLLTVDSNGDTQEIEKLLLPENHFELADVSACTQSLKEILTGDAQALTVGLRYSLMCAVRMRRLVQSAAGRAMLLRLQYQATAILLGCHPDSGVLFSFFQDKVDLIKNFMYLLRTGPGSLDYKPDVVDLDIRLLACQCLEAIVGSRDQSSTPIFARYPWMMFDLGLNRGQYMGLLPCLIRSATSYLISLDSQEAELAAQESAAAVESKMEVAGDGALEDTTGSVLADPEAEARLLWIENVFMLLIAIVNVSTALPALTDNGLIGSILLVMERLNLRSRSNTLIFVEIMTIEILESSVTSHSPAMVSFKEKNGMEVIINRLCRELQLYFTEDQSAPTTAAVTVPGAYTKGTFTSIPVASSILIQEFFSLLTSVLQEGRNDSADRNGQWYKTPALAQSLRLIFSNAKALGSLVLSPAVSLLAEIINNDPAPPSILSYMLSSGIAKEALCVLVGRNPADVDTAGAATEEKTDTPAEVNPSTPEVAFSSDSMLSLLCLMSSLSLTAEGISLVTAVAPFPAIFNMFFDPQYVYPTSRILMQDLPNMVGTNLEELLRHYPAYSAPCLAALTHAMQVITERADKYVSQANYTDQSGDINFTDDFAQVLHYSTGILLCLEPLLLKSQTILELHRLGAFKYVTTFLKIAMGPPRYVLDSFACMIDSTLNSLGYSPLLALVISRVCNQIAELEQKRMFECLMEDLQATVETLEADLLLYATRYGPAEVSRFIAGEVTSVHLVPPTAGGNGNPLIEGVLDTVTRDPIQDCTDPEGPLSDKHLSFARVLRGFSLLDCLAEAIGTTLTQRGNIAQTKDCIAQLTAPAGRELVSRILNKLYLPTQLEMARARGMFVNSSKDSCVKAHPVYHLLVVAADTVVVKDSLEDTANKVCRLGRGTSVLAYERRTAGSGNMLKYRTKDGWINVFRNSSSSDPLVLVTHVSKKSPEEYAEEVARNQDLFSDADKRCDFEKFASVSAKRGGFLAFYHFNHSVKTHLLSILSRHIFAREVTASGLQESISVSAHAVPVVNMLLGCLVSLIPELPNDTPRSTFDLDALFNTAKSPSGASKASTRKGKSASSDKFAAADSAGMPSVAVTSAILKEKYFQKDPVPLLDQFPTSMLYATIRLVEMGHMLFFETRRGKNELNPLIMAHLVYSHEYLERIFHAASILFLCALPDTALEAEDLPEHRHLYKGKWYPLPESALDQDREEIAEDSAVEVCSSSSATAMEVDSPPDNKSKAKGKAAKGKGKAKGKDVSDQEAAQPSAKPAFTPFPTYLAYRRALRERRLLAVSSIDNVANLFKMLCTAVSSSQSNQVQLSSTEKVLHRDANDEHDYDPYAMRRHILNTMTKYLMQLWSHPQLHHLPPYTTKNMLDLLAVVIKSLHDLKATTSVRAPVTAAPTAASSAGSALSSMDALLRGSRLGAAQRRGIPTIGDLVNMRAAARAAVVPAVSEESIRALEEMGFSRRAILRASREMHTNDVNQLVPCLLENPYFDEPEPPAAAAPAAAATASSASGATSSAGAAPADANATGAAPAVAGSSSSAAPAEPAAASTGPTSTGGPDNLDAPNFDDLFGNIYDALMGPPAGDSHSASRTDLQSIATASSTVAIDGRAARDKEKEAKSPRVNPLPLIAKQTETALRLERDLVQRILKCIYGDVPSLCLSLIEHGPSKLLTLLDVDIKSANSGVTREIFTVQVLNSMVNCLDKNPLPDVLLRIVQLTWLYHRAIHFFGQEQLSTAQYSSLYGVLHAILVLLTSKVRTNGNPHQSSCNELLMLVFTVDNRYNKLYPIMVAALEKYSSELRDAAPAGEGGSTEGADWIAPAILILDIVTQPILVDSVSLGFHLNELDGYIKMNPSATLTDSAADLTSADDSILSEQVRAVINKTFLRKKAASAPGLASLDELFGPSPRNGSFDGLFGYDMGAWDPPPEESASSASGSAGPSRRGKRGKAAPAKSPEPVVDEKKEEPKEDGPAPAVDAPAPLPLYEDAISAELKLRCLNLGLGLLTLSSQGKALSATIPQATMQLIAHLTRHPDARKEFHKQQGGILILRCPSGFDGMPSVVFTLLQQVLEDEKYLAQSMITAIRLCLLRLSKQKSQPVLLKNFIEVICPVVFREQTLFMKLLKQHTQVKSVGGEKFISLREGVPADSKVPATDAPATSSSTALVPATGVAQDTTAATADQSKAESAAAVAPATKRQRLQDGSAHTTSSAHKAPAGATPSATSAAASSGIKSGAKRVLSHDAAVSTAAPVVQTSSAVKQSASAAALAAMSNESVNEIVDELFSRIVCKWLSIKSMDHEGKTKLSTQQNAVDTSLTISDMLIIAADLIASLPTFAICVHRYCYNVAKVPEWAAETAKAELPLKHAITGQSVGGLFITFVIHALLLPAKILQYPAQTEPTVSAEQALKNRTAQNTAVEKLTGTTLRDACAYFLASLASRPGDGRKRVLNEILNSANVGAVVINRTDQLRCLVAFAEVLQYLIFPPARWASRDAFILPSKDILMQLAKLNAHTRISAAICAIDLDHPLALEASIVLSVPLETIIKKGLEAPAAAATDVAVQKVAPVLAITSGAATAGTSVSRQNSNDSATGATASAAAAPVAIANGAAAAGTSSNGAATTTPSVRRATFAPSTAPSSAPAAPSQSSNASAQSFVTPAMNRRRGNTDQSLDAEERLLLLTGSEMHSNSDQHGHLMRPTGAVADSDGSDAGFDDEGDDEEGDMDDGEEREVTLGHDDDGEGDSDGDDDDGEGEEFDEETDDGSDPDGSDDGSDSPGHHHHHHHPHHPSDSEESGSEGGHSGHMDSESEGSEGSEDEDDDSQVDMNESGEFDMDGLEEIDDDDEGDGSDGPALEIEMEYDGDSAGEGEGSDPGDGSEEEEEGSAEDEGSDAEGEEIDGDGDEIEEMGLEDESEIDDEAADIDQDGQDEDHMLETNALVRRGRGRGRPPTRRVTHAAMDEAENPGEGDDDSDSDEGDHDDDHEDGEGEDHHEMVNENSMDYGGEDGGEEGDEFQEEDYLEDAEFAPELHAENDGEGDEGEGENDEEDDPSENNDHEHHWLNMGDTAAAAATSSSARRASNNAARPIVRDYFNRVRHHERNRGRNSMGGGGGAGGAHAMNDLAALMGAVTRNGGSEVFSFPGGAVLSGGVLQAQGDGDEAVEFEGGNGGGFSTRRLFMRGGAGGDPFANLGVGGSTDLGVSMAASLQQFVNNMLPPNMAMTSSSARVDPRTGAVTLSFGGERRDGSGPPGGSGDANMTATAVQPPSHPLLSVTDARRNRFLASGLANSIGGSGRSNPFVRSMSFPYQYQQSGSQTSSLDSSFRRGAISVRRRAIGPIVSDRRWGTDMGDVEPAGARLSTLTTAVEEALGDAIEKEESKLPKRRASVDKTHEGEKPHPLLRAPGFSFMRMGRPDAAGDEAGRAQSGVHYESDESSPSEGEHSDPDGTRSQPPRRRRILGFDPDESKEEEGELQETKEQEPLPAASASSASASQASASLASAAPAAPEECGVRQAAFVPAPAEAAPEAPSGAASAELVAPVAADTEAAMDVVETTAAPSTESSASAESSSAPLSVNTAAIDESAPMAVDAAPVEISEENLQFVESLPLELRQEVLISAEEDFLRSLPAAIQREAQDLREQQAMELQLGTYELPSSALVPPAASAVLVAPVASATAPASGAAATDAPNVDFASLIGSLQRRAEAAPASAPASAAPSAAPSAGAHLLAAATATVPAPSASGSSATNGGASSTSGNNSAALGLLSRLMAASGASVAGGSSSTFAPAHLSSSSSAGSSASSSHEGTTAVAATSGAAPAAPAATSSAAVVVATPAQTEEQKAAAELALTVTLTEDRLDPPPFGSHLMARLLRSLFCTNKTKLPKGILKLLATACRYKHGRVWIMRALIGSLSHNGQRVADCVRRIPLEAEAAANPAQTTAYETEMQLLRDTVNETVHNPLNFRRILCGISFLFRKTEKLAWFDIMQRPFPQEDSTWMFGALIALLANPLNASSVNLEFLLQVMEELCGQYSKMTVKQANILAQAAMERIEASRPPRSGRSVSYAAGEQLETIPEGVEESGGGKRRRLDEPSTPEVASLLSPPSRGRAASIDIEGAASEVAAANSSAATATTSSAADPATAMAVITKSDAATEKKDVKVSPARVRMPFPVLTDSEAKMLCVLAGSNECGGAARKRLMRVMRSLSLCDTNWMLFLDHLSVVGADLAARATTEFSNLHNTLVEVAQNNETAAAAMARPELSTPRALSEVRLLNVLRIMTALRARSGEAAAAESEVVSSKMRRIQAGSLWDTLCECLDIVRDLEGITDVGADEVEDHKKSSNNADGKKMEEDKKVTLSSLTMRFMPLIECFLTVCATTMLVRPDSVNANGSALNDAQRELERMSSGFKRRHSRDDTLAGSSSSSSGGLRVSTAGRQSPATPGPHGSLDLSSPMNRVNSMLPGSRFRQHASYFQMQMELNDEASADRLVNFVRQNRILFNNVLRNNVQLLESSFSPLVSVPKCRQLLHFDIKRAYFKMKLKRMRQSAARTHGALRLNVRRSRVFEESFQALRYKTADEMRRRLSVNFHGEEGMDAGGLTREWYGVLAREIFNADYALFTSTGDNVTFQPNAQSYINPDHQSYFKFVGRVIGKAICDGHLLDAHFTRSFYKHILGLPVSVVDLEAIDPEYFKSLKQILATPLDLLGLDLTFSAESNDFGVVSIVDLIPQGRDVPVTDDTKHEYVKLLAHHRMTTAIRVQIDSFLEGFHELVPPELISIFDAQELELLISGLPDIDLDDLRAHTDYHSYKSTDPEIGHFWNVLKSFSKQEKALFLQFVTGTSKVPLDGFQALQGSDGVKQFNIHKAFGGSNMLPSAHTCFNQLDLPEYPSEDVLREKLLIAIREGSEGFGFA